jgi:hypothetical protein
MIPVEKPDDSIMVYPNGVFVLRPKPAEIKYAPNA